MSRSPDLASLLSGEPSAVDAFLRGLSREALVKLVRERAKEDETLAAWLLVKARSKDIRSPKAALRTVERAFQLDGHLDYRNTPTYIARADQAVDLLEAIPKAGDWKAAADLSEYALRLGFAAIVQIDDFGGGFGMTLQRVADIHAHACSRGGIPGLQLADRVFALLMDDPWDVIAPDAYRKALGGEGLERFRENVRCEWEKLPALGPGSRGRGHTGKRYALTALMRWLAAGSLDTDVLIAIEERDLSHPGAFLRIAELLKKAKRNDEALAWAERGAASFAGGPREALRDFLVAQYHRRKQHDRALALRWEDFKKHFGLDTYSALKRSAAPAGTWSDWRERALAFLRSKAAKRPRAGRAWGEHASAVLTETHLSEGDLSAALAQARAAACSQQLWFRIAAACEPERPDDAIAIYSEHLDRIIDGKNDRAYDEAAKVLSKIGALMRREGQASQFLDVLAGVQTRHKAKRNLMKRLEPVAAEARKRGPGG